MTFVETHFHNPKIFTFDNPAGKITELETLKPPT